MKGDAARDPASPVAIARRLLARHRLERAAAFLGFAVLLLALALAGDARGIPALGAFGGAAAALLTYRLRQVDEAITELRRREQEREALADALLAEVLDNIRGAHRVYKYQTLAQIRWRMAAEPGRLPFMLPDPAAARVHRATLDRLLLLPPGVVAPVVSYYAADASLNAGIAALSRGPLRALAPERQERFVDALFARLAEVYPVPDPGAPVGERMRVRRASKAWRAARALQDCAATCQKAVAELRELEVR